MERLVEQAHQTKKRGLERMRDRFDRNRQHPHLQQLFLEVTPRCNLSCFHCGSRCDEHSQVEEVSLAEWYDVIDQVIADFGPHVFIAITGGEPTLWPDLCKLGTYITNHGLSWGMTTNGTLIDTQMAERLVAAGLTSVSISIDGLPKTHDSVRRVAGSCEAAVQGVRALASTGALKALQVTSVMNHATLSELDALFEDMVRLPIDSWRVVGVEPIGSALDHPDMLMTPTDQQHLFEFIRAKRVEKWPVTYGCSHYLGADFEGELRDWFWFCSAGIHIMSIMHTGDIGSCLDIERRPETLFSNIRRDRLVNVWREGFGIYRTPHGLADRNTTCAACPDKHYCRGDSAHSWDFDASAPRFCARHIFADNSACTPASEPARTSPSAPVRTSPSAPDRC